MELNPLFANVLAWIVMIAALALIGWWVIGLYWVRHRGQENEPPEADLPGHQHETFAAVPAVLVIFYAFMFLSCVGYVVFVWLGGIRY